MGLVRVSIYHSRGESSTPVVTVEGTVSHGHWVCAIALASNYVRSFHRPYPGTYSFTFVPNGRYVSLVSDEFHSEQVLRREMDSIR